MDIDKAAYDLGNMTKLHMEVLASSIEFKTRLLSGRIDAIVDLAQKLNIKRADGKKRTNFKTARQMCNLIALTMFGKPCDEVKEIDPDHIGKNKFVNDSLWQQARLADAIRYHSLRDRAKRYSVCNVKYDVLDRTIVSLDMYSRVGCGQLYPIEMDLRMSSLMGRSSLERRLQQIENLFERLSLVLYGFPSINMSYGINCKEVPKEAKLAFDMQQVIRHRLSWDEKGNPPHRDWNTMWTHSFDEPTNHSGVEFMTIKAADGLVKTAY